MRLKFSKMHGLGNDFMMIDAVNQVVSLDAERIRQWSDRHFGIGFDQLLVVEPADRDDVDFRYRIFNADGGEVEQCGNGARCFARFVVDKGLTDKESIAVSTMVGRIVLHLEADGQVRVDMGVPDFTPDSLPFIQPQAERYSLPLFKETLEIGAVSMGNPHAVTLVDNIDVAPVSLLGPQVENHPDFPARVNAGFMQIIDRSHVRLRVHERGAAETLACGTGACAAAVIGRNWGLLDEQVTVSLPGGDLRIQWAGAGEPVLMTGPATLVFDAEMELGDE